MQISSIYVTQRKLNRLSQLPSMLEAIDAGLSLPPILLSEFEDGSVHVEDGHHRFTAFWLSGREHLESDEYILIYKEENVRKRFGTITDLYERIKNDCSGIIKQIQRCGED